MLKSAFAAVAFSAMVFAGGFGLQVGNPEASPEARALHAAVTVKASGCVAPEKTRVTANAIGMVDGQRRTIPLKVVALSEPGFFAITGKWPGEGKWVIELVAENSGLYTGAIATVGASGVDHLHAKFVGGRRPTPEDIDSVLK